MANIDLFLFLLRVICSSLLLLLTLSLTLLQPTGNSAFGSQAPSESDALLAPLRTRVPHRRVIIFCSIALAACWIADAAVIAGRGIVEKVWEPAEALWRGEDVAVILNFLVWTGVVGIGAWKESYRKEVWSSMTLKVITLLAGTMEVTTFVLLCLGLRVFQNPIHRPEFRTLGPILHLFISLLRMLVLLPLLSVLFWSTHYLHVQPAAERTPLLASEATSGPSATDTLPVPSQDGNGMTNASQDRPKVDEKKPSPSGWEMVRMLWKIAPYLWPARVLYLQVFAICAIVLMVARRAITVLTQLAFAQLIDALVFGTSPWWPLATYIGLPFIDNDVFRNVSDVLWRPVMQYSAREMSFLSFDRLMDLSLSFHHKSKLGEVTAILDRGTAVNQLFEMLLFWVVPNLGDLVVAVLFTLFFFGPDIAAVLACVMGLYVVVSSFMVHWETRVYRELNDRYIAASGIRSDCLTNYETVKYFTGEEHASKRYRESVNSYQSVKVKVNLISNLSGFLQRVMVTLSFILGSLIIVQKITFGRATPGSFVVFITYLGQLTGPLLGLGHMYQFLRESLVDTEKLIELLNEPVDVQDKPGAEDLVVKDGVIEFENVSFSYNDRKGRAAVLNVSFIIPKGKHVALVGESGSGKSTIMRLLFRFYDLKEGEGRILIDGKDIRDITQKSLRSNIGVVPQDSVLFNETIAFNIGYGKFDATEEEIEAAACGAQLHERIMYFPDQYQTEVGERGVKLSGGEKQRVAIARTLLKDPPILVLDEATSALDTTTEKEIQKALNDLVKGRSSLTIAHRLSTIANADMILVLKDGQIVERGSHSELLKMNGTFAEMWAEHIKVEEDTHALKA